MKQESGSGRARPKKYTEEFKRSVVDQLLNSDKTAVEVAREFGVQPWNLRDWKRQYGSEAKPVDAPMPQSPQAMAQEIERLRKELARVTMQRDILKKTMGILSES
jgi:transposase